MLAQTEVVAVVMAVAGDVPLLLTVGDPDGVAALPAGPLLADHRSLQAGLRAWVQSQTGLRLGHVEQLYTFADRERTGAHQRVISVSYLGLTRPDAPAAGSERVCWRAWYDLFPWEDQRGLAGVTAADELAARLFAWAGQAATPAVEQARATRVEVAFGGGERDRQPENVLARYELAWEAGLLAESRDRPGFGDPTPVDAATGPRLRYDHRRIAATGIARLRTTIQYRPVVFELMPETFTLGQLQCVVEALSGTAIHKQNFRRLVETERLVEETGERTTGTGGRPAKLVRFREEVRTQRAAAGVRLPRTRTR